MYAELPFKLKAEGTYHNLGFFFDRISKFPRIINVGDISIKAKQAAGSATPRSRRSASPRPSCCRKARPPAPAEAADIVPKQPSAK